MPDRRSDHAPRLAARGRTPGPGDLAPDDGARRPGVRGGGGRRAERSHASHAARLACAPGELLQREPARGHACGRADGQALEGHRRHRPRDHRRRFRHFSTCGPVGVLERLDVWLSVAAGSCIRLEGLAGLRGSRPPVPAGKKLLGQRPVPRWETGAGLTLGLRGRHLRRLGDCKNWHRMLAPTAGPGPRAGGPHRVRVCQVDSHYRNTPRAGAGGPHRFRVCQVDAHYRKTPRAGAGAPLLALLAEEDQANPRQAAGLGLRLA
mmetsp:Transcript_24066/g.81266  ORF Transcript_24066/g.81266 Transcript_24066/m.81266 type:complete len:264 (+) Transcript_24066:372-1163(+)